MRRPRSIERRECHTLQRGCDTKRRGCDSLSTPEAEADRSDGDGVFLKTVAFCRIRPVVVPAPFPVVPALQRAPISSAPPMETAYAITARPRKGRVSLIRGINSDAQDGQDGGTSSFLRRQEPRSPFPFVVSLSNHACHAPVGNRPQHGTIAQSEGRPVTDPRRQRRIRRPRWRHRVAQGAH